MRATEATRRHLPVGPAHLEVHCTVQELNLLFPVVGQWSKT